MSIRAEVEELVDWISDLSAARDGTKKSDSPPVPRENWEEVARHLNAASQKVSSAETRLRGSGGFAADLAHDLRREAQELARRAHMLSCRAKPKPDPGTHAREGQPDFDTPIAPYPGTDATGAAIEAAHRALDPSSHADDPDLKFFEQDLEVLAEMTLALRQEDPDA